MWHEGLIFKIKSLLPSSCHKILESYLTNRNFRVRFKEYTTDEHCINAGVPQGSVLGPLLFNLFTSDLPISNRVMTSTFADDTAFLCTHTCLRTATNTLNTHLRLVEEWLSKWRIKVNEQKSKHVTFTLKTMTNATVTLNGIVVP